MHPDEIENMGDGYRNESQRCYAEAQMLLEVKDETQKAYALARAGRYVIINRGEVCCRATDALVGIDVSIQGDFATMEEAQSVCGEECEDHHIITPEAKLQMDTRLARADLPSATDDEIPF